MPALCGLAFSFNNEVSKTDKREEALCVSDKVANCEWEGSRWRR
jgi:hypothetical protein